MAFSLTFALPIMGGAVLGALIGRLLRTLIHRLPLAMLDTPPGPPLSIQRVTQGPARGLVEMLCALWLALCSLQWGASLQAVAQGGAGLCLIALAFIDAEHLLLPDVLTQPLLWAGLLAASLGWTGAATQEALTGAALGYALIAVPATLYRWRTGSDGLGMGDARLLAATGAWQGPMAVPAVLLAAGVCSLIWAGWRKGLRTAEPYPFGPWLATASLCGWLWP